jgi:hypothetical protein
VVPRNWLDLGRRIQEVLVTVMLWGIAITAIMLAVRFLTRQRSDPLALRDTGSIRVEYVMAESAAQGQLDRDQWHRRLM